MAESKKKSTARKKTNGKRSQGKSVKRSKEANKSPYREEIILVVTLVISLLIILSYFNLSSIFGTGVNFVLFGLFGFCAYFIPFILFFGIAFAISNQGSLSARIKLISSGVLYLVITGMLDLIVKGNHFDGFDEIFVESAKSRSAGGIIGGALSKGLCFIFGTVGAYIVYIGIITILIMLITEKFLFAGLREQRKKNVKIKAERRAEFTHEEVQDNKKGKKPVKIFTFSREDKDNIKKAGTEELVIEKQKKSEKKNKLEPGIEE
ncbi:MAG: DNA translocase FtsK 4TM domain-containing protein, partial [Velocimicrobium sp.]